MTTTAEYTETTSTETVRNGVNTATMFATLDAHRRPPRVRGAAEGRCHQPAGGGGHGRHIGPDVTAPPSG